MMNDYFSIKTENRNFKRFQPEDSIKIHERTLEYFKVVLTNRNKHRNTVLISHHAPSHLSIGYYHQDDYLMNGGYFSDLSDLILDYEPNLWIHGHMHYPVDYDIGKTKVISNPKGYPNEKNKSYKNLTVEI